MSIRTFLETAPLYPLIKFQGGSDLKRISVPFTGAPRKHPYDSEKILVITAPFTSETEIYEFRLQDIIHVEDLSGVGTDHGENLLLTRVWVKKGSYGLKLDPFEVDSPPRFFKDSELLHQVLHDQE